MQALIVIAVLLAVSPVFGGQMVALNIASMPTTYEKATLALDGDYREPWAYARKVLRGAAPNMGTDRLCRETGVREIYPW